MVTCKSSNLTFCITCKVCKKQYFGQTKNRLIGRFGAYITNIKNNKKDVSRHFNLENHIVFIDTRNNIVDFIHIPPESKFAAVLRTIIEFHWIQKPGTVIPMGLNTMDKAPLSSEYCCVSCNKRQY